MRYLCMGTKKKALLFSIAFFVLVNGCSFSNVFNSDLSQVSDYYAFLRKELNDLEREFLYKSSDALLSKLGHPIEIQKGAYFGFNEMCEKNKCDCQEGTCVQKMSDELWIYVYKNAKASRSVLFYIMNDKVVRIKN